MAVNHGGDTHTSLLKISRPLRKALVFTVVAVLVTVGAALWACMAITKVVVLFLGLEGTALLASAFSPPVDEQAGNPKRGWKRVLWHFTEEASGLNYPVNYNPVLLYAGLICLALAMLLSAISG